MKTYNKHKNLINFYFNYVLDFFNLSIFIRNYLIKKLYQVPSDENIENSKKNFKSLFAVSFIQHSLLPKILKPNNQKILSITKIITDAPQITKIYICANYYFFV
jgi:hypothetical protein